MAPAIPFDSRVDSTPAPAALGHLNNRVISVAHERRQSRISGKMAVRSVMTSALNTLELTGRASTHVREAPGLDARLHARGDRPAPCRCVKLPPQPVSTWRWSPASGISSRQVGIWNAKFRGERPTARSSWPAARRRHVSTNAAACDAILLWSALPGCEPAPLGDGFRRHRPGRRCRRTTSPQLTVAEFAPGGPFARLNEWLGANLARFGFFRPYTTDRGRRASGAMAPELCAGVRAGARGR